MSNLGSLSSFFAISSSYIFNNFSIISLLGFFILSGVIKSKSSYLIELICSLRTLNNVFTKNSKFISF